jgi:hypothetical protein
MWHGHQPGPAHRGRHYPAGTAFAARGRGHRDLPARGQRRGADGGARGRRPAAPQPRRAAGAPAADRRRRRRRRPNASRSADARPAHPALPAPAHGPAVARALVQLWSTHRPDVVHIATEGPLGWSALQAALHLQLPVVSDFRTNFHAYSRHYGIGWLRKPIMAYLRKFHNRTHAPWCPPSPARELQASGFRHVTVVARGRHAACSPRAAQRCLARGLGRGPTTTWWWPAWAAWRREEPGHAAGGLPGHAPRRTRPARLLLVGDGPCGRTAGRLPRRHLRRPARGEDLAAHYASADLFLFPSLTETFGNVTPRPWPAVWPCWPPLHRWCAMA